MSYRYMRIIIFFDLPVLTAEERREYRKFRNLLEKEGFIMLQESVYCKIALNNTASELIKNKLRKNKPKDGIVQMLTITEKQFSSIENLIGSINKRTIDSCDRLVIL